MLCTELFLVGGSNMKIQGMLAVSLIGAVIVDLGLTKGVPSSETQGQLVGSIKCSW